MLLYPECQEMAHEEIKRVIGSKRLPEFDDRDSLPCVECVMQEVLRWRPVLSMCVPHRALEDDVYEGVSIPKDTVIIPNLLGMGLNEAVYKDASTFDPSRSDQLLQEEESPVLTQHLGSGDESVPEGMANETVWIAVATVLATVTIEKPIGDDGEEFMPEIEFEAGITCHPLPFPCRILPRKWEWM